MDSSQVNRGQNQVYILQPENKIPSLKEKIHENKVLDQLKEIKKTVDHFEAISEKKITKIGRNDVDNSIKELKKFEKTINKIEKQKVNSDDDNKNTLEMITGDDKKIISKGVEKLFERERQAYTDSVQPKSKNRHQQNLKTLDGWRNFDSQASDKLESLKPKISSFNTIISKKPLSEIQQRDIDHFINIGEKFLNVYRNLKSYEKNKKDMTQLISITEKLLLAEERKLENSHLGNSINRHQSNIDNLNNLLDEFKMHLKNLGEIFKYSRLNHS
ncbi:MAG: hypothetical protein Q8K60_07975 [Parachlamydiaceae bacterium]|nr:hypothetical protein [Parachlamydiaceae bacterium]